MVNEVIFPRCISCLVSQSEVFPQSNTSDIKPNLLIIHTDEHNFRIFGCYRETLSNEQALMWGPNTIVKTPDIDRITHPKYVDGESLSPQMKDPQEPLVKPCNQSPLVVMLIIKMQKVHYPIWVLLSLNNSF